MRSALAIAFACGLLIGGPCSAVARTINKRLLFPEAPRVPLALQPDDTRAGMCDAFDGLAFTFCVALCEAHECDLLGTDDSTCALLRRGFARTSDGAAAPCDADVSSAQSL
jgi:hypothetical protein